MSELVLEPGRWIEEDRSCVFVAFELLAIWYGMTQRHKDFVQKIYDILFYDNSYSLFHNVPCEIFKSPPERVTPQNAKPYHNSFEYKYYHALSRTLYPWRELKSLRPDEMRQFKAWYEEFLALDSPTEALYLFLPQIQGINNIINNFKL